MSERIILRETVKTLPREALSGYFSAAVEHVTSLEPALHLLSHPDITQPIEDDVLLRSYDAGERHALSGEETVNALPDAVLPADSMWGQGVGLLCAATGRLKQLGLPLTHNQLCDQVDKIASAHPLYHEEFCSGFYTIRSVALPVYRRLKRDGHPRQVMLLQTLLHLLAWKSDSYYARQQAQRLLWQGGILGEEGLQKLTALDDVLNTRQIGRKDLPALLAFTDILACFPAGPFFID
jgi:triphosphoribosyl-dephospho-CoA synthetase